MAEHHHQQPQRHHGEGGLKGLLPERGPTTSQVVSVAALLPLGGTLLALSGITLALTVVGLAAATPVFVVFSPVLVPAGLAVGMGVAGFLASGLLGLTGVTSLSWIARYVMGAKEKASEQMEQWRRRMADTAAQAGQRTKEVGERIQTKAHEAK